MDDNKTIEQQIVEKLGVDQDTINKIQSGETDLDTFATTYFSNYETNLKTRLMPDLKRDAMSDAFGKAYGKAEKTILDAFGIDPAKYENVDKSERFSTIVSDVKKLQEEQLNGFASADAQKLIQLTNQLEQANNLIRQKETEKETELSALRNQYKAEKDAAIVAKMQNDLIGSVENARLSAKEMRFIVRGQMLENGFATEIDNDGRIWIVKDGGRVPNPERATENLTFDSFFKMVATEFDFKKKSNGDDTKSGTVKLEGNPNFENLPPQFVKYMQEQGLT